MNRLGARIRAGEQNPGDGRGLAKPQEAHGSGPRRSGLEHCTRLLRQKGAPFTEIDVDDREDLRSWLMSASGQRTVPQIFVNGEPLGGYTDVAALDQEGKLDPLLAEAPPAGAAALPG